MATGLATDLTRAALMGAFDPKSLINLEASDGTARLRKLAAAATEVQVKDKWLWTLTPDARRAGLAQVPGPKDRAALLAGLPVVKDDALATALRQVLTGGKTPPVVARLRRSVPRAEDLPATLQLLQAVEMLRGAGVMLEGWAADPDISRQLARVTVQADKAAASAQILPRKLYGRGRELDAFVEFARSGVVRSPPFVMPNVVMPATPSAPPTVILSGLGGTGKSTLLEALRRRLGRERSVVRVVFDLDLPALRAGHRVSLTQELLRQIGEERPALDKKLSALRQTLRGAVSATTETVDPGREASAVFAALSDLNAILSAEASDDPIALVLIFDTFEEALILGPDRVWLIADWIGLLASNRLSPRVILSGRETATLALSSLPGLALQGSVLLGDLGVQAGRALLRDRFIAGKVGALDLVPKLVQTFGSDPLTLMMLGRFAANLGKKGRALRKDLADLTGEDSSAVRAQLDAEMRQTFLLSRILNRLPTKELQALANPGLALRQVTPQLILEVLAGPRGLAETMTPAAAEALFDRLAAMVWLVKPVAPGARVVEHLPDLRRRMLPQVLQDPMALAVVQAAADWFGARSASGDAAAGLEAIYYRALVDPDSLPSDPDMLRALADHLGPAVNDLGFARERFRDARGGVISHAAVEAMASPAVQKRARERRRKFQLSEGLESAVVAEAAAGAEPDPGEGMSVDLVAARFAALEFRAVAAEAPGLVLMLLDRLAGTIMRLTKMADMTSDELQALSVAALQATSACLAPDADPKALSVLRKELSYWLEKPMRREDLLASFGSALQQSSQLWPAKLAAVLVLSLADDGVLRELGDPVVAAVRGMAQGSHNPFAWRALRLIGTLREEDAVKGIALAYLAPEILPVLASSVTKTETGEVSQALKSILATAGGVSISDHNRLDAALFREDVTLAQVLPVLGRLPATFPGRLPEFHGAFRLLFRGSDLTPTMVQEAVTLVARMVPWWPKELGAEAFAEAPFSPTLISSLIDTADRCGRLPDLATALARTKGAPEACGRLVALIDAILRHYRTGAGVVSPS
jgi:hypothetical protein